ncbi:MAG: Serine/threonine-protein kinase PknD [Phycisphaerales bacterium]|nr:Serine/threonine-protein kinase PknD [Phycisphaerales bacterium]
MPPVDDSNLPTFHTPAPSGSSPPTISTAGNDHASASLEGPGVCIGPYRLLQLIGEGGFGSVFMAQQEQPVQRLVALKIIKLGMDTRQVVARFEQERQALAVMDHPNIARVFDAGATQSGRPFFVMELVKGDPIVDFCDKDNLSVQERLDLFAQVCSAIQHAHTKGIIHRDIKPSNVLVSTQDGKPSPKVIDFGIAKATVARLTEKTVFTEQRQLIGTPEYMSPEQAEGSLDIDTRTDVYSLGVLLYELLTGTTPFSVNDLRSAAYGEIQRIIREVDPPAPSTRLSRSTATIATIASRRRTEPRRLNSLIRGELDWIVMKAMSKDRSRRYETASSLGADIRRFLSGEAVIAAPPSAVYRLRTFARRHKGGVTSAAMVAAALVVGVAAFAWQAKVARGQRDRAVEAEARAKLRADELQKVSDFQSEMLAQIDAEAAGIRLITDLRKRYEEQLAAAGVPEDQRAEQVLAFTDELGRVNATDAALELINSTLLKPSLAAIDRQFADQPMIDVKLRAALAARFTQLGLQADALATSEQTLAILRKSVGEDDPQVAGALIDRAKALNVAGRHADAEESMRAVIERLRERPPPDPAFLPLALDSRADALVSLGRPADAELLYREALDLFRQRQGPDGANSLVTATSLGDCLQVLGKFVEAQTLQEDVLDRKRRLLGENDPATIGSLHNIGVLHLAQGRYDLAEVTFRDVLEKRRRSLGEAHPRTMGTANNLASVLQRLERHEEALTLQRETFERTRKVVGPDHPFAILALNNLGTGLIGVGKFAEAEPLCREMLERQLRVFGPNHPRTLIAYNVMSFLLRKQEKPDQAEPFLRQAVEVSRTVLGEDHPERMVFLINYGSLLKDLGRLEPAEDALHDAADRCARVLGADHPYTHAAGKNYADTLLLESKFNEAATVYRKIEPGIRGAAKGPDLTLAGVLVGLGKCDAAARQYATAQTALLEARDMLAAIKPLPRRAMRECLQALIDLAAAMHAEDPAGGHDARAAPWKTELEAIAQPAAAPPPK